VLPLDGDVKEALSKPPDILLVLLCSRKMVGIIPNPMPEDSGTGSLPGWELRYPSTRELGTVQSPQPWKESDMMMPRNLLGTLTGQ